MATIRETLDWDRSASVIRAVMATRAKYPNSLKMEDYHPIRQRRKEVDMLALMSGFEGAKGRLPKRLSEEEREKRIDAALAKLERN